MAAYPNPLPLQRYNQEGIYTCWSTCAEMIMEWVGSIHVSQCEQADPTYYPESSPCCSQNMILTSQCDWAWVPEFEVWGFDYYYTYGTPLSWAAAKAEIDAGRPFAFSWSLTQSTASTFSPGDPSSVTSSSHMMIVIGYVETTGPNPQRTLHCLNPASFDPTEDLMVPFEHYEGGPATTVIGTPVFYNHEHNYSMIQLYQ